MTLAAATPAPNSENDHRAQLAGDRDQLGIGPSGGDPLAQVERGPSPQGDEIDVLDDAEDPAGRRHDRRWRSPRSTSPPAPRRRAGRRCTCRRAPTSPPTPAHRRSARRPHLGAQIPVSEDPEAVSSRSTTTAVPGRRSSARPPPEWWCPGRTPPAPRGSGSHRLIGVLTDGSRASMCSSVGSSRSDRATNCSPCGADNTARASSTSIRYSVESSAARASKPVGRPDNIDACPNSSPAPSTSSTLPSLTISMARPGPSADTGRAPRPARTPCRPPRMTPARPPPRPAAPLRGRACRTAVRPEERGPPVDTAPACLGRHSASGPRRITARLRPGAHGRPGARGHRRGARQDAAALAPLDEE